MREAATRRSIFALAALLGLGALSAELRAQPATRPAAGRGVTFISTSDSHYAAFVNEDRNQRNRDTLRQINEVTGLHWPAALGGGPIEKPRGVVLLGDVIDDGDRLHEGENQSRRQYASFLADFGLDGTDGFLRFRVFEGWGNHDGPPAGAEKHGFSFQAELRKRNALRKQKGLISGLSDNGLHYSWDWDDVHFVQLNLYPADRQREGVRYSATWHDPQGSLAFLRKDLSENVGPSGRPVVLLSHCGFDTDWWTPEDWRELYAVARPFNVVLYLYGHTGTGVSHWAPPGESAKWLCINDGQTENGFFVITIGPERLQHAYRCKVWKTEPNPTGPPRKTFTGQWEWRWTGSAATRPGQSRQ